MVILIIKAVIIFFTAFSYVPFAMLYYVNDISINDDTSKIVTSTLIVRNTLG